MDAIEFPGVNVRIAEDQPEYQTLPAFVGDIPMTCEVCEGNPANLNPGFVPCPACKGEGVLKVPGITCCFKLTPEELAEVARTGVIWHTVLTFGQPLQPQRMSLQRPDWVPEK